MRCRHCSLAESTGRSQKGAALIVAMLVFALATALVVAMKSEFNRFYQRSANILMEEQAQAALRSAEELAGIALRADYDLDKSKGLWRDDLTEVWAAPQQPVPLEKIAWVSGMLEDLQGRFNLNTLARHVQQPDGETGASRFTAEQEQFIRLLQALGEPQVSEQNAIIITESITDWLDTDQIPSLDGAEDEVYSAQNPPYRAANRPMASVSELLAVANVTPEIYRALQDWVTVWPQETGAKLNIHTAPEMVLRSINADHDLSPLGEAEGKSLVEYREDTGFKDVNDFLANQVFAGKQMTLTKALLDNKSSWFLAQAKVEIAGRNTCLYSVLERNNRKITAMARASGGLYTDTGSKDDERRKKDTEGMIQICAAQP